MVLRCISWKHETSCLHSGYVKLVVKHTLGEKVILSYRIHNSFNNPEGIVFANDGRMSFHA